MQKSSFNTRLLWSRRMSVPIEAEQVAFAPRGDYLLLASSEKAKAEYRGVVEVLTTARGLVEKHLTFSGQFHTAIWSPLNTVFGAVGTTVVEGEYQGIGCLWDIKTGRLAEPFSIGEERVFRCAVFSPDGKSLYIGTHRAESQGRIYAWDIASRRVIGKIEGDSPIAFWSLALTTDGKTLAAGSGKARQNGESWTDCAVRFYDTATGRPNIIFPRPNGQAPTVVALSSDNRFLVTGDGPNGDVLIYEVPSGKKTRTLKGHQGEVHTVAVSPNGKWIVTGGKDRTVRLWSVETGMSVAVLTRHEGEIKSTAFSPDSQYLATGDSNGELHLWEVREK